MFDLVTKTLAITTLTSMLIGCHAIAPKAHDRDVEPLEMTVIQEVTVQAAEIAMEYGDYDEAMRLFREVLKTTRSRPKRLLVLVIFIWQRKTGDVLNRYLQEQQN